MFKDIIRRPIDPIPFEYVKNLKRLEYEPDFSFTCFAIALLKPRIEDYAGVQGKYYTFNDERYCVEHFISYSKDVDTFPAFCYYKYSIKDEHPEEIEKMLTYAGFKIKETIGAFVNSKSGVRCVAAYNETVNCAAIFINSQDIRYYHMLMSFIPLLYPSLFKDNPLKQPEEYNVVVSLSKSDKALFVQRIAEAVKPYEMEFRRMMLTNLIKAMHEGKINDAEMTVNRHRDFLANLQDQLANEVIALKNAIVTYEGLKATENFDGPEEDLVEYLTNNKQVRNLDVSGNKLTFSVATLLNNYNADAWQVFAKKGYIYDGKYGRGVVEPDLLAVFREMKNRKILLDNIFSESPDFAVKIAGNYTLDLHTNMVSTQRDYAYEDADPIYENYVKNPHLALFRCLGGYEHRISKVMQQRNYISAVEMCIASAGSVDLDETEQTFRPFLGWVLSSRKKILRRYDGVDMTPEEALIWLIDKEKENETDSNE